MFGDILMHATVVLVALFSHPKLTYEFSVPKYAILTLAISILFTYLMFKWIKEKKIKFYITSAHVLWFAFGIVSIISSFNVLRDNPYYFRRSFDIALYVLFNVLLAIYFSTVYKDKQKISTLLFTFLITSFVISVDALLNFYFGFDLFLGKVGEPFTRAAIKSTVGNVIFTANYIDMLLPIALYFILSFDLGLKKPNFLKVFFLKLFASISFIVGLTAVIVSQTRSEYIAIIIMSSLYVIFYLVWARKKKNKAFETIRKNDEQLAKKLLVLTKYLLIGVLVLSALIVVLYNTPNPLTGNGKVSMTSRFSAMTSVSSKDERFLSWFTSLELWEDHKIFGTGIGTYQLLSITKMGEYLEKHPELYYGWNNFKRAHNDYFQILGETGLVGFILIISLLFSLAYFFFTIPKKIEERDDLILFLSLSVAVVGFAIQSVFSFPGHLLPNALAATFFASVAIGPYFTKKEFKEFKGFLAVVIAFLIVVIAYTSMYLRWNHFISEVNFKNGNIAYMTYVKILEELPKAKGYIQQLQKKLDDLKNYRGQYAYLDPEKWKIKKQREYMQKGLPYNEFEVENQRVAEINKIRNQILSQISQINSQSSQLPQLALTYYKTAKEKLIKSVKINHTYGKSFFYLATLSVQDYRIANLKNNIQTHYREIFAQNFDEFQKIIYDKYKYRWLEKLEPYVKQNPEILTKFDFATMQALIDSVGLYKTSLLSFNERNTYKAIAMRYHSLHNMAKQLLSVLPKDSEYYNYVKSLVVEFFEEYIRYAKITIQNMPGGWNRFPDWKNADVSKATAGQDIYRFFAGMILKLQPPTNLEVRSFLEWLAVTEIKAVKYMNLKGVWGVPNGVIDFLHASAFEYYKAGQYQEMLYSLEKLADLYKASYINARNQLPKYIRRLDTTVDNIKIIYREQLLSVLTNSNIPKPAIDAILSLFEKAIDDINTTFKSYNFMSSEAEYMKKLTQTTFSKWYDQRKNNVWVSIAVEKLNNFITQLQKMGLNVETLLKVKSTLQKIIASPSNASVVESYSRFIAHYELILNDLKYLASNLKERYSELTDNMWENVIEEWSKVYTEDGTPLKSKEDIMSYLNNILGK
ncbi:O-antigen ligase family protein [Thermosipho atlanticus]|uniref:O-antigen ligase n=1 Tax=Thermosipho atlanticus DSM 15807 TaxID=1123380 RepID=A0A1M5SZ12_9BACT|nr:O-antigen ligase family protein [Thermosipho atlanticus]SHH43729.1 O-antigen ligase [Thermosipho atlanticus DSM 15807]